MTCRSLLRVVQPTVPARYDATGATPTLPCGAGRATATPHLPETGAARVAAHGSHDERAARSMLYQASGNVLAFPTRPPITSGGWAA